MSKSYHSQKIWPFAKIVRRVLEENPEAKENDKLFARLLKEEIPALENKEKCANCGASMREYIIKLDTLNAMLLVRMGNEVKRRVNAGQDFTEANKIRVSNQEHWKHSIRCRTNKCRVLGLIAKADETAHWSVTRRGFKALRGEKVPAKVVSWRNQIEERFDEQTTLKEVFNEARKKKDERVQKTIESYDPQNWYEFGDTHQGKLI